MGLFENLIKAPKLFKLLSVTIDKHIG